MQIHADYLRTIVLNTNYTSPAPHPTWTVFSVADR